ncbi:MAG: 3-hydroxyacyl-CoA dehydrogenase PaaH [Motiliproteus sp.]
MSHQQNQSSTDTLAPQSVIAVIGAGTMGEGIAQVAATAGHPVLLFDVMAGAASLALQRMATGLQRQIDRGRMRAEQRDALLARIQVAESLSQLAPAQLVIEAVVERLEVKQQLFGDLESICSANVILASNTSSISLTAIGSALQRPQRLVGMHFFNPAPVMKLVEVISGLETDSGVADSVYRLAESWGKQAVHTQSTPGFIVNRVARPFYAEALRVLQEGGSDIASIDALIKGAGGFRMGPFELMDLIGHDINYAVTCSVFNAYYQDPRFKPSLIQQDLVNAGHLGRKSERGFYDYRPGAVNPPATLAGPQQAPDSVRVEGDLGPAATLLERMQAAGISVLGEKGEGEDEGESALIRVGSAVLQLCNGELSSARAVSSGEPNLVQFDLALDYAQATMIALAPADQADAGAIADAVGLFQAAGFEVCLIDDIPGMVLMRTLCMLANEGFDAVNQRVCSEAAVDIAMQGGVNYPRGPLSWARSLGLRRCLGVLDQLAGIYGEERYRASPLLRRQALAEAVAEVAKVANNKQGALR